MIRHHAAAAREIFVAPPPGFLAPNTIPQSRKVDIYLLQDTVSSTLGNHAVEFGAGIRFQRVNNFFLPNGIPDDTFTEDIFNGNTVSTYLRPGVIDNGSARSLQFGLRFVF